MAPLITNCTTMLLNDEQERRDSLQELIEESAHMIDDDWESEDEEELKYDDETDSSDEVSCSLGSSSTSCTERAVSFSVAIKHHEIPGREDLSEKEIRKCWYSSEDKEKTITSKDKIVARLEKGKAPKPDTTYRGLECWTQKGGQELDESIARVVDAVMDEQDRQWALNSDDWNQIAYMSLAVTAESALRAVKVAKNDAYAAKLAWEKPSTDLCMSQHSSAEEDSLPGNPRANMFNVFKRRLDKQPKRRPSTMDLMAEPILEEETMPSPVSAAEEDEKTLRKIKKSKKKSKKKHKKLRRRSTLDPPAPVKRTKSQDGSDMLLQMRTASRHMSSVRV